MTPAIVAAQRAGLTHRVHEYEHDPSAASYGLEAAEALGLSPERVFKTLVVKVSGRREGKDGLAVGVVPVHRQLDLKAIARALGARKAAMADTTEAERATGCVVGGISPLGLKRPLPMVVDASAAEHETVNVSAGRRGLEIELSPDDLVTACRAELAAIARD
ncbi:MAG: Cys-tRNA(Pro) deacylase [Acidobacteriota bacterium]